MKQPMILLGMLVSLLTYSQKESIYILKIVDDMEDKTKYYVSRSLICKNDKQGFKLSCFVDGKTDDELHIKDLSLKMVGIGSCVENNSLILKFEDETKLELKSWNKFNCEGNAWFTINNQQIELLSTKKIVKIRVQNGKTYDSYTTELTEDTDYFIQLFQAIKNKKIKKETK